MATTGFFLNQYFTTTLNVGGGIDNSQTTGIILTDVSGIDTSKPGVALINYADPLNTTIAEWVTFTSIDGSKELQGVVRGAEGFSAKSHDNGVSVAFPLSESHVNNLTTALSISGVATNLVTSTISLTDDITDAATELVTASYVGKQTTATTDATPNPTGDAKVNEYYLTALGSAAEFAAPSGTPTNGNILRIRILDDGTGRALTYNAIYRAIGITLPTTTTASKTTYIGAIYNSADSKWDCVATVTEA